MKMNEEYVNRGMDLKRLTLYLQKKLWIVIMLIIVGGSLGGIIYQMVRALKMPVEYESISKLYISFGHDENGEAYQYYNGYTWNDLLDADPIMDLIMEGLPGYERSQVQEATTAQILSDIRLLTVSVRGGNEKFVREVCYAVEAALVKYAKESEELSQIRVIRSGAPSRVFWDNRTTAACVTGALVVGIIAMLVLGFSYAVDESIYVQGDIEKKYSYKALGILTKNQKGLQPYARELRANLRYVLGDRREYAVLDMDNHGDVRKTELDRLLNRDEFGILGGDGQPQEEFDWLGAAEAEETASSDHGLTEEKSKDSDQWQAVSFNENIMGEEECSQIRELGGVVVLIPFGTNVGRRTERILSLLKNQDCEILGMIVAQADEEFLNRYFA